MILCVFQHEQASLAMFDYLVKDNDLKSVMEEHGLVLPEDLDFIKEQIAGPLGTNGDKAEGVTSTSAYMRSVDTCISIIVVLFYCRNFTKGTKNLLRNSGAKTGFWLEELWIQFSSCKMGPGSSWRVGSDLEPWIRASAATEHYFIQSFFHFEHFMPPNCTKFATPLPWATERNLASLKSMHWTVFDSSHYNKMRVRHGTLTCSES